MATRNGVEVEFKGTNTDLLRAIRQNVDSFADMRRQFDQHLDAITASARRTTGVLTSTFNGLQSTLRATDTRLVETARHIDRLGDEADTAAAAVRRLDAALAGLGRFGGVGGFTGGVFATNSNGTTTFIPGPGGGAAAAAAAGAAGAAAGGVFRGGPGPGPSFTSTSNFFGTIGAPTGGVAPLAGAAAIGATAAGLTPAGIFRGPGGRFMNEAQMRASLGQGPIIEGSLASAEDAGAAFRAAQAAQAAAAGPPPWATRSAAVMREEQERARRMASGLPDPDANKLEARLLFSLSALAHLRPRGWARVGLSIPGMAIGEAAEGRVAFANPLTSARLSPEDMAQNMRRPMMMWPIPPGAPPGLIPNSADESFWRDERYGRHRLGAGLGGMGVAGLTATAKGAEGVLKGLGGTAAIAGAGIAAGLAVGIGAVVALKDQAQAAVDTFLEADIAQFRMDFQLEQAGLSDYTDALREWNNERAKVIPFDDDALASAEGILARTFGTPDELRRYTSLVADVAAVTGRDLDTVAAAFVKFRTSGSGRIFSELGVDIRGVGDDVVTSAEAFQLLEEQVGGAAEELGGRSAGQMQIAKNRLGDISEEIGGRLAPLFIDLAEKSAGWLEQLLNPAEGSGLDALQDSLDGIDFGPLKDGFTELGGHTSRIVQEMQIDLAGWVQEHDEEINDMLADFGETVEAMKPVVTGFFEWFNWNVKNTILLISGIADAIEWTLRQLGKPTLTGVQAGIATPVPSAAFNLPKGTAPGSGPKGPKKMHSGGMVPGLPGTEVLTILTAGEQVTPAGGGSMRPIVINTSGSRYQKALLEDLARAARGQGLQVLVK